ncbi:MAG: hypothetical protein LBT14_06690 [Treponema sp.]|jgi:hypothetical protein|nr:hypothetical protein [Treponema sp.]
MQYRTALYGLLLAATLITGCATSPVTKLEKINTDAPDAAAYLLDELKTKKVIFINEAHIIMNEELFLAEHVQEFYDAGVRYFFSESNITRDHLEPMYPWMSGGANRVEARELRQVLLSLEQSTASKDPFKVVWTEEGENYDNYDPSNEVAWLNYRDEYSAKNIIETLNNAPTDAKAICYFGGAHGVKIVTKGSGFSNEANIDRTPLGYLLSKRYGSAFTSLSFLAADYNIRPEFEDAWKRSVSGSKIVLPKDVQWYYGDKLSSNYYDALIAEKEAYYGTPSNYVPSDEALRYWARYLKEYALKDPTLLEKARQVELDSLSLVTLYYLKLYYGDHFNYTLWRSPLGAQSSSLLQALEELESYAFNESVKPSEMIRFHNSLEDMRLYGWYMFFSLINEVCYGRNIADIVETGNIRFLTNARELFPEDIWSLYWLAFIQAETGAYAEGLANFQELFTNDLSLSMSILPLAYKKAAKCAAGQGNTSLSKEYTALSEGLYNEHGIDPSQGPFSIETGYHLK